MVVIFVKAPPRGIHPERLDFAGMSDRAEDPASTLTVRPAPVMGRIRGVPKGFCRPREMGIAECLAVGVFVTSRLECASGLGEPRAPFGGVKMCRTDLENSRRRTH